MSIRIPYGTRITKLRDGARDRPIVVIVASGDVYGGAERQIIATTTWMQRQGIDLHTLLFYKGELLQRLRERDVAVHVIGKQKSVDRAAVHDIRRLLSELHPSGIHVHGYRATVYLALAGVSDSINIVKTEHGFPEPGKSAFERLKLHCYRVLENRAVRKLGARIVYVTRDLQCRLRAEHEGIERFVIHNGVDFDELAQVTNADIFPPNRTNLVIVGRIDAVKGIRYAIDAIASGRLPNSVHCHIIGDGPLRADLEAQCNRLGVDSNVHFEGFQPNAYDFIACADALLMPSLHEGLPYAALEACALRTPLIASRIGGLAEVFHDRETAYLFNVADSDDVCTAILLLMNDDALRRKVVSNAYHFVSTTLSASEMSRAYARLLVGKIDD